MKDSKTIGLSSRREFFQQIMLTSAGLCLFPLLQGCDDGNAIEIPEGSGAPPFKTWEEMLYALQFSPDNYKAKRDRLVQQKDPKAMFDFVRDEFMLLPSDARYFQRTTYGGMYGVEGALRTGMATIREKAEILKNMLIESGFEAKVITEHIEMTEEQAKDILFKRHDVGFYLPVSKRQLKKWRKELGVTEVNGKITEVENVVERGRELAQSLLQKTTPEQRKEDRESKFMLSNNNIPGVTFKNGEEDVYLHLFDPKVEYGKMHPDNKNQNVRDTTKFKEDDFEVTLTVKGTTSFDMRNEKELIKGTFKASELIGNQLKISFLNNLTFEEQASQGIDSISTYTPSIALQDLDKDAEYLQERSVVGEPITLGGEKVFEEVVIFSEVYGEEKQAGNPEQVVSMGVKANPKVFPEVQLELFPKDAEGNLVEGLSAGNFKIEDNGTVVRGMLRKNIIAPKILLIFDTSGSMPREYRGTGIKSFLDQMQQNIREIYPSARIELMATGSNVYTTHLKAAQTSNDLVLYATDGHNNDKYLPQFKEIYESGPPIIYLNVYDHKKYYDSLRENIDITEIPASDQEAVIEQTKNILGQLELAPYLFTYNALNREGNHQVEVSLTKTSHTAQDDYQFPEVAETAVGKRLVGLYLYVKIGNQRENRRVLAGFDKALEYYAQPTKKMVQEVHEALLGSMTIAFEKAGATTSVRLSEYLQTLLSTRNWMEPYLDGNSREAVAKLQEGFFDYPAPLLSMMQPIEESVNENSATYVEGLRVGILRFTPALYSEESKVSFDYLRTAQYRTLTRNGKNWFAANAEKTAQLALLEAANFPQSTYSELDALPLKYSQAADIRETISQDFLGDDYNYFREYIHRGGDYNFFDAQAKKKAFWNIDGNYGELFGVLPDMTGGGGESVQLQLEHLQSVVDEYQKVVAALGNMMIVTGGGMALGIVAAYSVTLVKLYAYASEAIILMDASNLDDQVVHAMQGLACSVYKEITYSSLGPVGSGMAGVENLIAMMGGDFSFVSC
ncbi:MAG: hypothetical protein VX798_00895 [Bacteroidota bacterium]|uniref:VWFA domain-containing protein n=1 Tax=Flagellimonas profundi TaxID=2915620 RepID=A0ABS3FIC3_9FLAO|nr:hypothetical protein [Allomuricauda profundi]MBO0342667.1 hypothetical protein [Allomuricauda profundi]MEC7769708.1 hypothetical protein [Bacteroidota bacterium]